MDDLSDKRENENEKTGNLLDPQERLILEQIVTGGPPHSQRAQSLLTIDAGVTQKTAALQSGQTVGQVSYWLGKFRRDRMSIFPEELLRQTKTEASPTKQLTDTVTPAESPEINQPVEQGAKEENELRDAAEPESGKEKEKTKKKSKKGKDSKKAKKMKKSKKVKSSKKAKKDKKNGKKNQGKKSRKRKKKSKKK
jgi:outer membrane biosynthesis protein TonB